MSLSGPLTLSTQQQMHMHMASEQRQAHAPLHMLIRKANLIAASSSSVIASDAQSASFSSSSVNAAATHANIAVDDACVIADEQSGKAESAADQDDQQSPSPHHRHISMSPPQVECASFGIPKPKYQSPHRMRSTQVAASLHPTSSEDDFRQPSDTLTTSLPSGSVVSSHPSLGEWGQSGEDAWCLSDDHRLMGVSDGVGGWSSIQGANSALWAMGIMQGALQAWHVMRQNQLQQARQANAQSQETASRLAVELMWAGYRCALRKQVLGSATACVVLFDPDDMMLRYANLGDSGFAVYRQSKLHFKCDEFQHSFNLPAQLGSGCEDTPDDSISSSLSVQVGDIVVIGTDGLLDNVSEHEIATVIGMHQKQNPNINANQTKQRNDRQAALDNAQQVHLQNLPDLAREIAEFALACSRDPHRMTPFSLAAKRHRINHKGGKEDDITLIVAQIRQAKQSANNESLSGHSSNADAAGFASRSNIHSKL